MGNCLTPEENIKDIINKENNDNENEIKGEDDLNLIFDLE